MEQLFYFSLGVAFLSVTIFIIALIYVVVTNKELIKNIVIDYFNTKIKTIKGGK